MSDISLIEHKLRQYFYLGHKYSIYVTPLLRVQKPKKNQPHIDHICGVQLIGKIAKKNQAKDINSIVPTILKVKKEGKLIDESHLIFALAVCARINLNQCKKMVIDAYDAILSVCTDGLKLLMFVKFYRDANIILRTEGYTSTVSSGFGIGFRKAMRKWYLSRDPLLVTEQIEKHKSYEGLTHKDVIKMNRIYPTDPSQKIFIIYTLEGMKKVEKFFGSQMNSIQIESECENKNEYKNFQLKYIYNHIKGVHNMKKMDITTLKNEIELQRWGHDYQVVPKNMLLNPTILMSLVSHMPLRDLLENTYFFAKHQLFFNDQADLGVLEYISRFENTVQLKKHGIHPIESYLQCVIYSRKLQKKLQVNFNDLKKANVCKIEKEYIMHDNKFRYLIDTSQKKNNKLNSKKAEVADIKNQLSTLNIEENNSSQSESNVMLLMTPPPKLSEKLIQFLSIDLIKKTLKILEPTGQRILIAYDNRMYTKICKCRGTPLLSIHEAITLIILSLMVPEKSTIKPIVLGLNKNSIPEKIEIENCDSLLFEELENILFKKTFEDDTFYSMQNIPDVDICSAVEWVKTYNIEFDVFVFLGTSKMNYTHPLYFTKELKRCFKKPIKTILCCLNGNHVYQRNLSHEGMLYISGFDKNVGKIIQSFINGF